MEKRRVLMVGAGGFARAWGRILKDSADKVDFAGWVDIAPGVAAEAAALLKLDGIYTGTDLERGIAAVGPDFVLNLTIPSAHCEVAIQAMEAGLPVLCEKPMAATMEQAREMIAASERTGQLLMISQQRRYDARIAAMRSLVVDHLGPLGILNSDFYRGHPSGGFRDAMRSPLLLDMAIHTFDAARYVCGADPVSVWCEDFNPSWSWYPGNACATASFEMTGGLHYTYRGAWCSQGLDTSWEAEWRAVGPNGTVRWDGEGAPEAEVVAEPGAFPPRIARITGEVDQHFPTFLAGSLADFLHALDTGETPMGECHDNIKSLAMVFGAVESAMTGERVQVSW